MWIREKVSVVDNDKLHRYKTLDLFESDEIEVVTHATAFGVTGYVGSMQPDLIHLDINMPALAGDKLPSLPPDYSYPFVFLSSFTHPITSAAWWDNVTTTGEPGYPWKGNLDDFRIKVRRDISE